MRLPAIEIKNQRPDPELRHFAYDDSVIQFFSENEPINIKYALSQRAKDAIVYNVGAGDRKSKKIVKAFKYSFPAMGLFVASLLLAMFNVYEANSVNSGIGRTNVEIEQSSASRSETRVVTMADQTGNNTTPQNQPQTTEKPASPDPNVQAPQNVLITEGYEPPERPSSDMD